MTRSKWKGPYLYKEKQKNQFCKNSEILPIFVGKTFQIHNGKSFVEVLVTNDMINHKFGEFIFTRGKFSFKKKK
jgi:ribosomal protein S19